MLIVRCSIQRKGLILKLFIMRYVLRICYSKVVKFQEFATASEAYEVAKQLLSNDKVIKCNMYRILDDINL